MKRCVVICSMLLLLSFSCKKNDDKKPQPVPAKASVQLDIDHLFNGVDFQLGQDYQLPGGEIVNFSSAKFYLSQPAIYDRLGQENHIPTRYVFVEPHTEIVELGEINSGNTQVFRILVGVDSVTNTTVQPIDFPDDDHPLAPRGMYWSWASGYIFYEFEGSFENANDTVDGDFIYHIGLNQFSFPVTGNINGEVSAGEVLNIQMNVDYSMIFKDLDLATENNTQTMDNFPLAEKIRDNFQSAIEVKREVD